MTVKELKDFLGRLPDDMDGMVVGIYGNECGVCGRLERAWRV